MSAPITSVSYALVALLAVLTGTFRRHDGYIRPLVAIGSMVSLLALGLAFGSLAARNNALLPLVWALAIVPIPVCGWLLFGSEILAIRHQRPRQVA
jgi:lipopolysaccharide export system permease protein